ncbi:MAG: hypothetical protein LBI27_02060, partial [Clostridiales bacterium]|nr:hypothetical protein [Clostridiales bacterium]
MKKVISFFLIFILILQIIPVGATQETRDRLRELERRSSSAGQRVNEQRKVREGTEHEMSQVMAEMQALDQLI